MNKENTYLIIPHIKRWPSYSLLTVLFNDFFQLHGLYDIEW
jgi:hypothetical protein